MSDLEKSNAEDVVSPVTNDGTEFGTEEDSRRSGASGQESKDMAAMATSELEGSKDTLNTDQLGGAMSSLSQLKMLAEAAAKDKKLAAEADSIKISPELISLLASEMAISETNAERTLKKFNGDFEKSLLSLVNA